MVTRTYQISTFLGRTEFGDPMIGGMYGMPPAAGCAGGFTVGTTRDSNTLHLCLVGRELEGEGSETSRVLFEFILPQDYKAGTDAELIVNAGVFGGDTGGGSTINAEVYRLRPSDLPPLGGNLVTTPRQALAKSNFGPDGWPSYTFAVDGSRSQANLGPGDRLLIVVETVAVSGLMNLYAEVGEVKLNLECEEATMDPQDLANINVDSTGGALTLAKALEVIVARCVGDLAYDSPSRVVTFYGRNGATPVATVKLTGGGVRQDSNIP